MNIPPDFIKTIQNAFGEAGHLWLDQLPGLVAEASRRWGLADVRPVSDLSYNFVAFAKRGEDEIVLKIGVPNRELTSEIAALRLFDGKGAIRLLEADEGRYMFLLERVKPGQTLAALEDDDQATHIAADVMLNLRQPKPEQAMFIQLTDWFSELKKLRPTFKGGTGPFDENIIVEVEELLPSLFTESAQPKLIHGDLHHFNILSSERGWLAIDPKGIIGPAAYEVGPLLINPWGDIQKISQLAERRIAILSERLGFTRKSLRDWALCHSVLSAWWGIKPDGSGGEYSLACAEIFSQIRG